MASQTTFELENGRDSVGYLYATPDSKAKEIQIRWKIANVGDSECSRKPAFKILRVNN